MQGAAKLIEFGFLFFKELTRLQNVVSRVVFFGNAWVKHEHKCKRLKIKDQRLKVKG